MNKVCHYLRCYLNHYQHGNWALFILYFCFARNNVNICRCLVFFRYFCKIETPINNDFCTNTFSQYCLQQDTMCRYIYNAVCNAAHVCVCGIAREAIRGHIPYLYRCALCVALPNGGEGANLWLVVDKSIWPEG